MTDNQKIAYEWAKSHDYPSIAARYAREMAGLVDDLQGAYDAMVRDLAARTRQVRQLQEENAALRAQQEPVTNAMTQGNPCENCTTGWGTASANGVSSCHDSCERLAVYHARQKQTPCFHCGYGGKHLDAPTCTTCPAHPKGQQPNAPLTLDELREMDGEPVWCISLLDKSEEWGIMRVIEMAKTWFIAISGASRAFGDKDTYGKTWLAYRKKPEEDDHDERKENEHV